ncbi:hypothetical protein [Streptomyces radicis]|uniref:DUF7848 domain-containing protein n=1 Tax=Streptomyces radicis TaxID=1750517 RepID=UPI0011C4755A|nr:hypothetical protein [Streptomyces radicis]
MNNGQVSALVRRAMWGEGGNPVHIYKCQTCGTFSKPYAALDGPQPWARRHAIRASTPGHRMFARVAIDFWMAKITADQDAGTVATSDSKPSDAHMYRLRDAISTDVKVGDLLSVDDVFLLVLDLRAAGGAGRRVATLKSRRVPFVLEPGTIYEIKRSM